MRILKRTSFVHELNSPLANLITPFSRGFIGFSAQSTNFFSNCNQFANFGFRKACGCNHYLDLLFGYRLSLRAAFLSIEPFFSSPHPARNTRKPTRMRINRIEPYTTFYSFKNIHRYRSAALPPEDVKKNPTQRLSSH